MENEVIWTMLNYLLISKIVPGLVQSLKVTTASRTETLAGTCPYFALNS